MDLTSTPPTMEISGDQQKLASFTSLSKLLISWAVISILFYCLLYTQTGIWQIFIVALFLLISLLLTYISYALARHEHFSTAAVLAFCAITTAFATPLLVWSNAEGLLIVSGALVTFLVSTIFYSKWKSRLIAVALFLIATLITSRVRIYIRFDITLSPVLLFYLSAQAIMIAVIAAWQFIRKVNVSSIRTRLWVAFISIATIPLMIAAGVSTSINTSATEESAIDLLTNVASLKQAAVNEWLIDLKEDLHSAAPLEIVDNSASESQEGVIGPGDSTQILTSLLPRYQRLIDTNQFKEILILNQSGLVIASTNPDHELLELRNEPFFINGLVNEYTNPITSRSIFGSNTLTVSEPISNLNGRKLGVLAGIVNLDKLSEIMLDSGEIGSTGETYLVSSDLNMLTNSRSADFVAGNNIVESNGALNAILGKKSGSGIYENYQSIEVIGAYRWLPDLGVALLAEQSRSEIFAPSIRTIVVNFAISLALIAGASILGLLIANSIGKPLTELTGTAQQIAEGDINLEAPVGWRDDEISGLAQSFNRMTKRLRGLIGELEKRVQDRTSELEALNKQLITASQLSSRVASILDADELVAQVVNLIRDQFNLYYVGLFLVDEGNKWAVLKSGTGEAGRSMLAKQHRIKIGEGMIGWCIQNTQARIALKASEDTVRLVTPDLPDTRSEAAIPLGSRGLVIGALSIQSDKPDAFDEATIATFQTMADQIAVAIDNARLFAETQRSLEATRLAYGELSRNAWQERINTRAIQVQRNENGIKFTNLNLTDGSGQATNTHPHDVNGKFLLPIKVRGTVIGYINAQKSSESANWTDSEKEMFSTLTEQLGIALESARLYEETSTRAEREKVISQITNRVRETLDIETILRTATMEMRKVLNLDEVEVRMSQHSSQEPWK